MSGKTILDEINLEDVQKDADFVITGSRLDNQTETKHLGVKLAKKYG